MKKNVFLAIFCLMFSMQAKSQLIVYPYDENGIMYQLSKMRIKCNFGQLSSAKATEMDANCQQKIFSFIFTCSDILIKLWRNKNSPRTM